ncbi:phosphoadenylyl-sulfate reductase [Deltaproteobacteria bacterium TL4]
MSAILLEKDLIPINKMLENKSTEELLTWTFSMIPRVALLTSGQKAGSVLAKIVAKAGYKVDLFFVDTGVLFEETQETVEALSHAYQFPLRRFTPKLTMYEQYKQYGALYLNHAGQEQCCHMRKVEPLLEVYKDCDALLGPLRRGEGGRRANVPILGLDPIMKVIRINPMANLPEEQYQRYIKEEDTIINPLHDQGYPTIGCNRCTTPVRLDEPQRAGRWRHLSGVDYCGINPSDFLRKSASIEICDEIYQRLNDYISQSKANS